MVYIYQSNYQAATFHWFIPIKFVQETNKVQCRKFDILYNQDFLYIIIQTGKGIGCLTY